MQDQPVDKIIDNLSTDSPPYPVLLEIYQSLKSDTESKAELIVSRRAVAQVVCEILEYLEFVSEDVEKSFGITREDERKRIFDAIERPPEESPIERTRALIRQWDSVETIDPSVFR